MRKLLSFSCLAMLLFASCESVIELDLDAEAPQLVIDAFLQADAELATVRITRSNGFYDEAVADALSDADVVLDRVGGTSYILTESSPGTYTASGIGSVPGDRFVLTVELDGERYTAEAAVPPAVVLDEVTVEEFSSPFGGDGSFRVAARFTDPAGQENYYRIKVYDNGVLLTDGFTVVDDAFAGDGEEQTIPVRNFFDAGTSLRVELLSTDEAYYNYFFQISSAVGDGFNASVPFNPVGNFDAEVLGYFGVFNSSFIDIEV